MLKKIYAFPLTAYFALSSFFRDFKRDERGLSGVVVAILLILIAVLAVVLIWGFLSGWLAELWDRITGETASLA
jgi:flagellin-like protein